MIDPGRSFEHRCRWYVVQTRPRKEAVAVTNLRRQGFEPFLPQVRCSVRHARKTVEVARPLFPRYLFLPLDIGRDRWRPILSTLGVASVIMNGDRPRATPLGLVEDLIAATDWSGSVDLSQRLVVGGSVKLLRGPFADRIAQLIELDDGERVTVLLEVLGAARQVRVNAADLLPIAAS
jgi:transcription elongation factor/antiterminator RfaH